MKLLVLIYGPGGYNDPERLTAELIRALYRGSWGRARYEIVQMPATYERPPRQPGMVGTGSADYERIYADHRVRERIGSGEIDEVWLWGGPAAGFHEWKEEFSPKQFFTLGLNYERGLAEAMESYAHRSEYLLALHFGGGWNHLPGQALQTDWDRFTALDRNHPGQAGIGDAHEPHNARPGIEYDRSNPVPAYSAWRGESYGAERWGADGARYLEYWFANMPLAWWDTILLGQADYPLAFVTLDWDDLGAHDVYVSMDGGAEVLFSQGHGPAEANWIQPGHRYRFQLEQA